MRLPWVSREWFEDVRARLAAADRAREAEIERLRETYERMIEAQGASQRSAIEHLMNLISFGTPVKSEAIVEEREPDAAARAARRVSEETVLTAIARLREEYQKIGLQPTDAELDSEARTLVMGGQWRPPASLAAFIRD